MASSKTKVTIPIDNHETFVSVAKSFAQEGSVPEKLRSLYELQSTDKAIDALIQERGELPAEVEALEAAIATIDEKIASTREMIAAYQEHIKLQQQTIEEVALQSDKCREQLSSIKNNREYDSIMKEAENYDLTRSICEKNIRETRSEIEKCSDKIAALESSRKVREQDLAAKREELSEIVKSTAVKEQELMQRRNSLIASIDPRTVSAYERIRASKRNHLAVVTIENGACGGCSVAIAPQRIIDIRSGRKMIICENCGRIIVSDTPIEG